LTPESAPAALERRKKMSATKKPRWMSELKAKLKLSSAAHENRTERDASARSQETTWRGNGGQEQVLDPTSATWLAYTTNGVEISHFPASKIAAVVTAVNKKNQLLSSAQKHSKVDSSTQTAAPESPRAIDIQQSQPTKLPPYSCQVHSFHDIREFSARLWLRPELCQNSSKRSTPHSVAIPTILSSPPESRGFSKSTTTDKMKYPVDMLDRDDRTPLNVAAEAGATEIAMELLDRGAGLEVADYVGRTPLASGCALWKAGGRAAAACKRSGLGAQG
jgi:hypothetical protein